MARLLTVNALPRDFTYPSHFIRVVELGMVSLEPWWIMDSEDLFEKQRGLARVVVDRPVVAFAWRSDCQFIAFWEPDYT